MNTNAITLETHERRGDQHFSTGLKTPLREDAFTISDAEKKVMIAEHFEAIMNILDSVANVQGSASEGEFISLPIINVVTNNAHIAMVKL